MDHVTPKYQRVLVKLSGEALAGDGQGLDPGVLSEIAEDLASAVRAGVQVAVVIGGGNIFRGMSQAAEGMHRPLADSMGMLATMINALALQDALSRTGVEGTVLSAVPMPSVCDLFSWRGAVALLERGQVVILGGGTGNPYFTTDTAACLRGLEISADVVMKATKVDGVYDRDPMRDPNAVRFERLTFSECLRRDLKVMDATAISLCRDNDLPILVFDMLSRGSILAAVRGEPIGTIVTGENKTGG